MSKYLFFSGKGGVGKTTMACATAVHLAKEGRKTLIVSTDPASNLSDVFEQEIGHRITHLTSIENLAAMEIDPDEATREYKEGIIAPYRAIMPDDIISSIDEQLSGPCTTEMAAFDRFIDLMEKDEYEVIVFDTAPTGHTIRLLELPVDWSRHIDEAAKGTGQTCLGPVQTIQKSKARYDMATDNLRNTEKTVFIFVMRPDELSLFETVRASEELKTIGINSYELIINGILPEKVCDIPFFKRKYMAQEELLNRVNSSIKSTKKHILMRPTEVKGIKSLEDLAGELFQQKKHDFTPLVSSVEDYNLSIEHPDIERLFKPSGSTKSIFFTGKGGVGKTTISCITALYLSEKGYKTLLVTTDPAAHIGEVLDRKISNKPSQITKKLSAVLIDQEKAFREYKERILQDARGKYSDEMLIAMEEELNSPCTEEMAAFDKFVQFIESKDYDLIVFDTAPTGHTLRLIDLPFDYARQVEMMAGNHKGKDQEDHVNNRFRDIISFLRDKEHTIFCLVLYPESIPVLESYRAMIDLRNAGIETQLIVANMLLSKEVASNNFFKSRRSMQKKYLGEIKNRFSLPVLQFPLLEEEIKGYEKLTESIPYLQKALKV